MEYCIHYKERYSTTDLSDGVAENAIGERSCEYEFKVKSDLAACKRFQKFKKEKVIEGKTLGLPYFTGFWLERIDQREKRTRIKVSVA